MAKKYSKEIEEMIVELKNKGKSPYWMVKNVEELKDIRPSVIYGILNRYGIHGAKLTEKQKRDRRKYNLNDDYFESIDTEQKAYWLGFMIADGYVMSQTDKIGLSLSVKDKDHIEKFKEALNSESPIKDYIQNNGYGEGLIYSRLLMTSEKMKKDLIKLGISSNKTNIAKFPCIDNSLVIHMIRGYYDGDGSITYGSKLKCGDNNYNIKITGTKEVIQYIQKVFNVEGLKIHQRNSDIDINNWTLSIGGNLQVNNVLNKLYNNSTIHIDRKYKRYLELSNQISLSS